MRKNHTYSLASPYHAGHMLLWGGIPFFNQHLSQVSQRGSVGQTAPTSVQQVRGQGCWQAIPSSTLTYCGGIASDISCSVGGAHIVTLEEFGPRLWDCHRLRNLILISLSALK